MQLETYSAPTQDVSPQDVQTLSVDDVLAIRAVIIKDGFIVLKNEAMRNLVDGLDLPSTVIKVVVKKIAPSVDEPASEEESIDPGVSTDQSTDIQPLAASDPVPLPEPKQHQLPPPHEPPNRLQVIAAGYGFIVDVVRGGWRILDAQGRFICLCTREDEAGRIMHLLAAAEEARASADRGSDADVRGLSLGQLQERATAVGAVLTQHGLHYLLITDDGVIVHQEKLSTIAHHLNAIARRSR